MLIGFPPIFVADTKIIYGYNFVAPLTLNVTRCETYLITSNTISSQSRS